MWLVYQDRLLTKEGMHKLHIPMYNEDCCLCDDGVIETNSHLFAGCKRISEVRVVLRRQVGV